MVEGIASIWRNIPQRYRLEGNYCENCGTAYFPPRVVCVKCRRQGKLKTKIFCGKGKIETYTKVYTAPTGLELEVPYYLAIINLSEGPSILGQLVETDSEKIKIGSNVEFIFRKMREDGEEGLIQYGYKFKIV
ncbi:Zn-ribbon domain-containing OB-fold protein [Candidatus Micrarchaeota archaeon]|nr:Zn-ribbon domain-containing OB-fold protein [Candidatus Micrarchaeota archaeon]